jgi:type VI secretion system protein VasI
MDHARAVSLVLEADSGKNKWGEPIMLFLRCRSNETNMYIYWGDYVGEEVGVLTRVDKFAAETSQWSISTDGKATFYPGSPVSFIRNMFHAGQLIAQVNPYDEGPILAIFDIKGLKVAAVFTAYSPPIVNTVST